MRACQQSTEERKERSQLRLRVAGNRFACGLAPELAEPRSGFGLVESLELSRDTVSNSSQGNHFSRDEVCHYEACRSRLPQAGPKSVACASILLLGLGCHYQWKGIYLNSRTLNVRVGNKQHMESTSFSLEDASVIDQNFAKRIHLAGEHGSPLV